MESEQISKEEAKETMLSPESRPELRVSTMQDQVSNSDHVHSFRSTGHNGTTVKKLISSASSPALVIDSERSKDEMSRRLMIQKGKHQNLTTLMRTVKESIEQTIIEARNIEDLSFQDDSLHEQSDS
jgi:hypothetical protein